MSSFIHRRYFAPPPIPCVPLASLSHRTYSLGDRGVGTGVREVGRMGEEKVEGGEREGMTSFCSHRRYMSPGSVKVGRRVDGVKGEVQMAFMEDVEAEVDDTEVDDTAIQTNSEAVPIRIEW